MGLERSFLAATLAVFAAVSICHAAAPTGCKDGTFSGAYICDYRTWQTPIAFGDFSPQPQQLTVENVDGPLVNSTFASLTSVNPSTFLKPGEPGVLNIICAKNGNLMVEVGTFKGLGWLQRLKVQDCQTVGLPAKVFADIGYLDSLEFYGGNMDTLVADSLQGLLISKDKTLYEPKGLLSFQSTTLKSARIPTGFLSPIANNISAVTFNNVDLFKVKSGLFNGTKILEKIDLGRNSYTYLPPDLLTGVDSVNTLALDGVSWFCGCINGWFINWATQRGATIEGSLICSTPTDQTNVGFRYYYNQNCVTKTSTNEGLGVSLAGIWLPIQDLVVYGLTLITLVLSIVSLGCICCIKKSLKSGGAQKINVKPSNGAPGQSKFKNMVQRAQAANKQQKRKPSNSGKVTPSEVSVGIGGWD